MFFFSFSSSCFYPSWLARFALSRCALRRAAIAACMHVTNVPCFRKQGEERNHRSFLSSSLLFTFYSVLSVSLSVFHSRQRRDQSISLSHRVSACISPAWQWNLIQAKPIKKEKKRRKRDVRWRVAALSAIAADGRRRRYTRSPRRRETPSLKTLRAKQAST